MRSRPIITLDKVRGMFMGAFLGDALGAPHEFRCNSKTPYTGVLEHVPFNTSQFQGKRELSIGQITDDTELTLALLRTLIENRGYNKDKVIMSYLRWANSGGWMIGTNTRTLLRGVTTLKGYQTRLDKMVATTIISQSNGALMRCSPLALIWDNSAVVEDVNITNPTPVCIDCNLVYISALRLALQGVQGDSIFPSIKDLAQTKEVKEVLEQVEKREARNIAVNKGWCLHALWCTMMAITSFTDYSEAMRWIITSQPGSDTDTNACIAGALLGATLGFNALQEDPITSKNIQVLLNVNTHNGPTPRPLEYSPSDFYTLTEAAHALTL